MEYVKVPIPKHDIFPGKLKCHHAKALSDPVYGFGGSSDGY